MTEYVPVNTLAAGTRIAWTDRAAVIRPDTTDIETGFVRVVETVGDNEIVQFWPVP